MPTWRTTTTRGSSCPLAWEMYRYKRKERNLMSDLRVERKTDTPDATPAEGSESVADDAVPMTEE